MQHFLNDCSSVFPVISFQLAETHPASFEADAPSALPGGGVSGKVFR
jgi:hypothetical protein